MKRTGLLLALLVILATFRVSPVGAVENVQSLSGDIQISDITRTIPYAFILPNNTLAIVIFRSDGNSPSFTVMVNNATYSNNDFTVDHIVYEIYVFERHFNEAVNSVKLLSVDGVSVNQTLQLFGAIRIVQGWLDKGTSGSFDVVPGKVLFYSLHNLAGKLGVGSGSDTIDSITFDDEKVYTFMVSTTSITVQNGDTWHSNPFLLVSLYNPVVMFHVRDGLTDQPLAGVTVKEGNTILGTIGDGGTLELEVGTHTLTFEKSGYWSVTKTIDVTSDLTVSVEMYPSSAAFKFENFPADITAYENTIYELTFTLNPIDTSATYNTYLSLSGLSDVLEVRKDGSLVSPEGGKYYLGDISGPTQVSIKFKAGAVGQRGFTITLTSNDAIMSKTYTTTKTVTYTVEPLPFSVQMPSEWQVGQNELRISESSGQSYLITAVLKDSQGNEVWSDSHAFSPYEAHTFTINVPSEGSYTLELQWNGQTAVYDITVNPAITLKTKTLTVSKGGEGTIVLHFKNPSSSVQYYMIKVSGGFLPKEINQSISVAPLAEKDVSIAFAVPDNLQYDAYELQVQVLQGNATVFSDKVAVSISEGSGFSLFGGSSSGGKTLYYGLAVLAGLGLFIAILRRR